MTVTQLLRNTNARELIEWALYLKIYNEKPENSPTAVNENIKTSFMLPKLNKPRRKK